MSLFAANGGGQYSSKCSTKTDPLKNFEILQASCIAIRDSKDCKDLYTKIDKDSHTKEEANYKKLKCEKTDVERRQSGAVIGDALLACGAGLIVDPFLDLGRTLGEGAGWAVMNWEKARECDKSADLKMAYIQSFNLDVPELARMPMPSKEKINSMSCNQIQVMILNHRSTEVKALSRSLSAKEFSPTQKKLLTEKEKEFLTYDKQRLTGKAGQPGAGLLALVNKLWSELKIKDQCYSPEQTAKLRCEIAATIATTAIPGLFAIRAARLAKLSGIRIEELTAAIQAAERQTASLGGKLLNESEKLEILKRAGVLTNEERIAVFEKLLGGRKLSAEESAQLLKMHDVGSKEGRGFFDLTKEDLAEKIKLATKEINPKTGKPFFTADEANVLIRNGITGITGKEDLRIASQRGIADGFNTGTQAKIDESFSKGQSYYSEYLKLDDKKFADALGVGKVYGDTPSEVMALTAAATGGLKPEQTVQFAEKIIQTTGKPAAESMNQMSQALKVESDRLGEIIKKGTNSASELEFRQYMLLEARQRLEEAAAAKKYADKFKQLDFDKLESGDPIGYKRLMDLNAQLGVARENAHKQKRWPYKPSNSY